MENIRVSIVPRVYVIKCTSYSNNHPIFYFCQRCLSKSKTNKDYKEYTEVPATTLARVCCKCHSMDAFTAGLTFGLTLQKLINLAEAHYPLKISDTDKSVTFSIAKDYLVILKGKARHGKTG